MIAGPEESDEDEAIIGDRDFNDADALAYP